MPRQTIAGYLTKHAPRIWRRKFWALRGLVDDYEKRCGMAAAEAAKVRVRALAEESQQLVDEMLQEQEIFVREMRAFVEVSRDTTQDAEGRQL